MDRFTVIIPVHNEAENIAALYRELVTELAGLPHQVLVVDDGSTDGTREELARHAPEWRVLTGPREGKTRALQRALAEVDTAQVVMMDGDMQDDTAAVSALLWELEAGADCATGWRRERRDGWLGKRLPSLIFNFWLSLLFAFRIYDINTGLKAFRTDALRRIRWFEHCHRFLPLLVFLNGGSVVQVPVRHRARVAGEGKFNSPLRFVGGFVQALQLRLGRWSAAPLRVRFARMLPWLMVGLCGWFYFYWAGQEWYFTNYDAPAFVPPMVRYAADGQLINTYADTARHWDATGVGRQVGHGFLPTLVTGTLAAEPTYAAVHQVICWQMLLGVVGFVLLLGRLVPVRDGSAWAMGSLHALAVGCVGYFLLRMEGRPEVFVFLIVVASAWLFLALGSLGRSMQVGALLSVLAVTHPIAALFTGLLWLGWLCTLSSWSGVRRDLIVSALVTLVGLAVWFGWYPYRLSEWVQGNLTHAETAIVRVAAGRWWPLLTDLGSGPFAVLFLIPLVLLGLKCWRCRREMIWPLGVVAIALIWLGVAWYFGVRNAFTYYNLVWLVPFGILLLLAEWSRMCSRRWRVIFSVGLQGLLLLPAVAFVGEHAIRRERLADGPQPAEVRVLLKELLPPGRTESVLMSRQFFHLLPVHERRVVRSSKEYAGEGLSDLRYMLIAQADIRRLVPEERLGWRVVRHTYAPSTGWFGRVSGSGLNRGFQYALYVREGDVDVGLRAVADSQGHANGSEKRASNQ